MPLTYPHPIQNHFNTFQRRYGAHLRRILGNNFINTIINDGEVCGRHADDARLIHASVTAGLRGGLLLQTPQLDDHPDQWATFLPGEQGFAP